MSNRPVSTVLDALRPRVSADELDAVLFSLESVAADLGYGDVHALPGSIAWIDALRARDVRTAVVANGSVGTSALNLAGIADRFDAVIDGLREPDTYAGGLAELEAAPERAGLVDVAPEGLAAARGAGIRLPIALARGRATPEELRRAGAAIVVADLQELLSTI